MIPGKPGRAALPGPDLSGRFGQQFGLLINRVAALAAAFCDLALGGKDAIHRADPTKVDAFIGQRRIDFGGCLVGETRGLYLDKHLILFTFKQSTR